MIAQTMRDLSIRAKKRQAQSPCLTTLLTGQKEILAARNLNHQNRRTLKRKKKRRSKSRSRSRSSSSSRRDRKCSRRTRSQERREKKAATIARMGLDVTNVAASLVMPSAESKHPSVTNSSSVKPSPQLTSSTAASSSAVQAAAQQVLQSRVAEAQQVTGVTLPSFYNPAAVNPMKYAQQIQKRKLLWANKEKNDPPATSTAKLWEATAFTQDQDGKMTAKFKRLMGIKNDSTEGGAGAAQAVEDQQPESSADVLKKQQELFASLDQQYQVARATTHTQRGLGLGFGSSNSYPR
uniref:EOG090X0LFN n=1 Tax=Daphnia dolichocephala TaxID=2282166 RepID=A0A4Y7M694_9CRUS|nr:EOG090X0LFN [Daphnia dolichocephala]